MRDKASLNLNKIRSMSLFRGHAFMELCQIYLFHNDQIWSRVVELGWQMTCLVYCQT